MASYDQRNQRVYKQINIVEGPKPVDPDVVFKQGVQFLKVKSYQQSINFLNDAIKADPSIPYFYYYLALALLRGRRPKILKRSEIEEIDQLLSAATVGDSDATVQWFRALVRDDYYRGNRMNCPSPSVEDILGSIHPDAAINIDRLEELLVKLPMTDNQLYIILVKQIRDWRNI